MGSFLFYSMGEQAEKYHNWGALTEVRSTEKSTYSFTFILYLWAFVGGSGTKHNCDKREQKKRDWKSCPAQVSNVSVHDSQA